MTRTQEDEKVDEDLDCARVILLGKEVGFTTEEAIRMRWGELMDYLIAANEMAEERKRAREEKAKEEAQKKEPRASLMDL